MVKTKTLKSVRKEQNKKGERKRFWSGYKRTLAREGTMRAKKAAEGTGESDAHSAEGKKNYKRLKNYKRGN